MADIDEQIRKAVEEGKFDDLPGKGKPLKLADENAHEDPQWRLAHHVLRESGYLLPWIEMQREIDAEIAALRAGLRTAWEWRGNARQRGEPPALIEAEWQRAWKRLGEQAEKLNKRIFDFNLQTPSLAVQRLKLDLERELEALEAAGNPARDSQ